MEKNPYINNIIEFHILQSFPVTCLNRDDVGAPKTALIGEVTRARVSSQCWKREVRMQMQNLGAQNGIRTKKQKELFEKNLVDQGATEDQAKLCAEQVENDITGKDVLIFWSNEEIEKIVDFFKNKQFNAKDTTKSLDKFIKKSFKKTNALDIALFGRMVARFSPMNIQAACCFSHAISTHKVGNEVEFFTAVDDCRKDQEAAHLGCLEYNSATYYRYISLNLAQLYQVANIDIGQAIEYFIKALFLAIPSGRQNTQSGASCWDYAKVFIRKGQRLQVPFNKAITSINGDFLDPSIEALESYLEDKEKMSGSLFQKISEYTLGKKDHPFNIDELIDEIQKYVKGIK